MNTTILIMYMSYKGALEYMPRKFFFHWNLANFISSYTVNKRKIFKFFIRYMHKNINLQTFQYIWAWASNLNHTKKCHEKQICLDVLTVSTCRCRPGLSRGWHRRRDWVIILVSCCCRRGRSRISVGWPKNFGSPFL